MDVVADVSEIPARFKGRGRVARESRGRAMASEILGREAGRLRDASEHARPNLLVIVKCKNEVWPAVATERPMRAGTRLTCQPIRWRAARTRRAFVAGQLLTPLRT
jgi:hypothetical protein